MLAFIVINVYTMIHLKRNEDSLTQKQKKKNFKFVILVQGIWLIVMKID